MKPLNVFIHILSHSSNIKITIKIFHVSVILEKMIWLSLKSNNITIVSFQNVLYTYLVYWYKYL